MNYKNHFYSMLLYVMYVLFSTLVNLSVRLASVTFSWQAIFTCKTFLVAFMMFVFVKFWKKYKIKFSLDVFMVGCLSGITAFLWYLIVILVPMNTSMILSFLLPISVSVFGALFLREKLSFKNIFKLLISFGCAIFTLKASIDLHFDRALFLIFILITLRVFYAILQKISIKKTSQVSLNFAQQSMSEFLFVAILTFMKFGFEIDSELQRILISFKGLGYIFIIAIMSISGKLMYILSFKKSSQISHLQLLDFLKLPFSMFLSHFLLNEKTTIVQIVSSIIIITLSFSDILAIWIKKIVFIKRRRVA